MPGYTIEIPFEEFTHAWSESTSFSRASFSLCYKTFFVVRFLI